MKSVLHEAIGDIQSILGVQADPLETYHEGVRQHYPHHELYWLLKHISSAKTVRALRELDTDSLAIPNTPLGSLALELAVDNPAVDAAVFDRTICSEFEPRLLRSINQDHGTGIVYVDRDANPLAYRKYDGDPRVLLLEETPSLPGLTAGLVIDFPFDSASGSKANHRTLRVDMLPTTIPLNNVEVLRHSTFVLDPVYVQQTGYTPPANTGECGDHYAQLVLKADIADLLETT